MSAPGSSLGTEAADRAVQVHPSSGLVATGSRSDLVTSQRAASIRSTLSRYRQGRGDPTTSIGDREFWRATHTPDGPGTVRVRWGDGRVDTAAWGPGGPWLTARVPMMIGETDEHVRFEGAHQAIMRAQRNHPDVRLGGTADLFHELLPTILAQRITSGEAMRQWRLLCWRLGDLAPGPAPAGGVALRLPPLPQRLASTPTWWFHPLGIERSRASTLVEVGRHAEHLWDWASRGSVVTTEQLVRLSGVGEWTIGCVLDLALGEPDAVAVGDYHLKNIVAHALAGEARATDERMLELLEPYRGQRGRVVRLLQLDGHSAPKFGPRQRVLPMHRW